MDTEAGQIGGVETLDLRNAQQNAETGYNTAYSKLFGLNDKTKSQPEDRNMERLLHNVFTARLDILNAERKMAEAGHHADVQDELNLDIVTYERALDFLDHGRQDDSDFMRVSRRLLESAIYDKRTRDTDIDKVWMFIDDKVGGKLAMNYDQEMNSQIKKLFGTDSHGYGYSTMFEESLEVRAITKRDVRTLFVMRAEATKNHMYKGRVGRRDDGYYHPSLESRLADSERAVDFIDDKISNPEPMLRELDILSKQSLREATRDPGLQKRIPQVLDHIKSLFDIKQAA